jgi:hypothetical protein
MIHQTTDVSFYHHRILMLVDAITISMRLKLNEFYLNVYKKIIHQNNCT